MNVVRIDCGSAIMETPPEVEQNPTGHYHSDASQRTPRAFRSNQSMQMHYTCELLTIINSNYRPRF
jgi:hypothetical protein